MVLEVQFEPEKEQDEDWSIPHTYILIQRGLNYKKNSIKISSKHKYSTWFPAPNASKILGKGIYKQIKLDLKATHSKNHKELIPNPSMGQITNA